MKKLIFILLTVFLITSCNKELKIETEKNNTSGNNNDIIAVIETNKWDISIKMFVNELPITTLNFIWHAQNDYYDNVIFHRVIKDFMIQWWDPEGTWRWWISIYGDKFDDEFSEKYSNTRWTISMANAGPDTNWSQFFINLRDNSNLDFNKQPISSKHSVFGEVIKWMEIVDNISLVQTDSYDKPLEEIVIKDVKLYKNIKWKLEKYSFDIDVEKEKIQKNIKKSEEEKAKEKADKKEKNKNRIVKAGDIIAVKYTWTLDDWTVFDSNVDNVTNLEFNVGSWQMIPWFDNWVVWMKLDQEINIKIESKDAYGPGQIEIDRLQLKSFEDEWLELKVGTIIPTASWDIEIFELDNDKALVTNPHPLAWKNLNFKIKLVEFKN